MPCIASDANVQAPTCTSELRVKGTKMLSRPLLLVNSCIIVSLARLRISEISVATNFTVEATAISVTPRLCELRRRGGIRVFDEPEKPDFRFWIPLSPPKNRLNPDFHAWFSSEKPGKTGFSEHSEPGFIKMSLCAPPLLRRDSRDKTGQNAFLTSQNLWFKFSQSRIERTKRNTLLSEEVRCHECAYLQGGWGGWPTGNFMQQTPGVLCKKLRFETYPRLLTFRYVSC